MLDQKPVTVQIHQAAQTAPIFVTLPFAWGFEDGATGSPDIGEMYFVGAKLAEYNEGRQAGELAAAQRTR